MKDIILIQKSDIKSKSWAKAAASKNFGEMVPLNGSPMYMPFILLKFVLKGSTPKAVVFRYLNDYPSLFRSLQRTLTDLATIGLASLLGIKLFWICHNVDKESEMFYPVLTRQRRKFLKKKSHKIFVLDPLLVEPASQMLNYQRKDIIPISFGHLEVSKERISKAKQHPVLGKLIQWKSEKKSIDQNALFGLWIGSPSIKLIDGLIYLVDVVEKQNHRLPIYFIVVGSLGAWLRKINLEIYHKLEQNKYIWFEDSFIDIPPLLWRDFSDFVFKPSNDYSVNLTAYNSASAGLPIVGFKETFLGLLISQYELGVVVDKEVELIDNENFHQEIKSWSPHLGENFLAKKNWEESAKSFFQALS